MIVAVSWLPKGVAKAVPVVAELPSKEEIEELLKSGALEDGEESGSEAEDGDTEVDAEMETNEASQALAVAEALGAKSKTNKSSSGVDHIADGLKELDMDNYDDDDDEEIEIFSSGRGDVYYPSNEQDPYLKGVEVDDSDEEENLIIQPKDSVIVCARNDDDICSLEASNVSVCEDSGDGNLNIFPHHDIIVAAFPLCTAWLDCPLKGGEKGNFIAVGSMEPAIEIWDLDIIEQVEPSAVLGGVVEVQKKKKKKKKSKKKAPIQYKEGSHTDSVLGLAWNKQYRNILASASSDRQVKIWDVTTQQCNITSEHHTDKARMFSFNNYTAVQSVAWNHHEAQVLLSGSFDHSIVMKDARIPTHPGFRWSVAADVESLAWDPHSSHSFVASLENGTVQGFDIRTAKSGEASDLKPSYTIHAHDKAVSAVIYNPSIPNLIATGSMDKTVKIWDLSNNQPSCVASKNPKAGAVFSIVFSDDSPFILAIGGSKGTLEIWNTESDAAVSKRFGGYKDNKPSTSS
ncbi:unnamed protein product [Linum tenue]|uniref:Transducin/WD40 repeat-like superfamily protein n=1 Tax=Linum tenue TaxID=586396 RepID=A0AAV0N4R7_9ROSI|nr:unnamed protein product [Linum tenue]